MPYKIAAYEYFKIKNSVDDIGLLAGSVNTYFRDDTGKFQATSTDVDGFVEPVRSILPNLEHITVCVLGAGGAARACIAGAIQL